MPYLQRLVCVVVLQCFPVLIVGSFQIFYERDCIKAKSLRGTVFQTFTDFPNPNPGTCFAKCSQDCRCESFQFQQNSVNNSLCELNGFPFNSSEALVDREGFMFCNLKFEPKKDCRCEEGCCSTVSNPCKGGQCIANCGTRPRYKCICRNGEVGTKCDASRPRSCLEVLKIDPDAKSGHHTIYLTSDKYIKTQVYCDIDPFLKEAWTLVESFKFANQHQFNVPFYKNKELRYPDILSEYRMSLLWMTSVKSQSLNWRATCNYSPIIGLDMIDYVVTTFADIDLLSDKLSPGCYKVKYININNNQCNDCTAWFSQTTNESPHFSPKYGEVKGCSFRGPPDATLETRVFGNYTTMYKGFRCTSSLSSTTAYWFGGKL